MRAAAPPHWPCCETASAPKREGEVPWLSMQRSTYPRRPPQSVSLTRAEKCGAKRRSRLVRKRFPVGLQRMLPAWCGSGWRRDLSPCGSGTSSTQKACPWSAWMRAMRTPRSKCGRTRRIGTTQRLWPRSFARVGSSMSASRAEPATRSARCSPPARCSFAFGSSSRMRSEDCFAPSGFCLARQPAGSPGVPTKSWPVSLMPRHQCASLWRTSCRLD